MGEAAILSLAAENDARWGGAPPHSGQPTWL
jgi:hypothetical protein